MTIPAVVDISYDELVQDADTLTKNIEEAYGPDGLGILVVSGIANLIELRNAILTKSHNFASLPEHVKEDYVNELSLFGFGWSHGKEKFNGRNDTKKGSYYANPKFDFPTNDQNLIQDAPYNFLPNIWPSDDVVPSFADAFKNLGRVMVYVAELVSKACDKYIHQVHPKFKNDKLFRIVSDTRIPRGRLLYYFPSEDGHEDSNETDMDSWCGWHRDHSAITALTRAIYMDKNGNVIENKDEKAGLYIRARGGEVVKVSWREDQLAFQIGEAAQALSGGVLVATPHCVRASAHSNVARATMAVFMSPEGDVSLAPPEGVSISECGVDGLEPAMNFNAFSSKRYKQYYS
jgi:isopenicillin N synthase-like dioxygenase